MLMLLELVAKVIAIYQVPQVLNKSTLYLLSFQTVKLVFDAHLLNWLIRTSNPFLHF